MAWAALVPRARLHTMGWKEPLAVPLLLSVPRLRGARQAAELLANQEQHLFTSVLQRSPYPSAPGRAFAKT